MNNKNFGNKFAKLTKTEKLDLISNLYVPRPDIAALNVVLDRCLSRGQRMVRPTCLMVSGEPGVGKTRLLRQYTEQFPVTYSPGHFQRPILFVQVPACLSMSSLVDTVLCALEVPNSCKGSIRQRVTLIDVQLKAQGTQLVLIDEVQHLLGEDQNLTARALNMFKQIVNSTGCPFVFSGLPSSERLLEVDQQLARMCQHVEVSDFEVSLAADFTSFRIWLRAVDEQLPFSRHVRIADTDFARQLFAATKGNPALIMRVIQELCFSAVEAGREFPTEADIDAGFKSLGFDLSKHRVPENVTGSRQASLPRKVSHAPKVAAVRSVKRTVVGQVVGWLKSRWRQSA